MVLWFVENMKPLQKFWITIFHLNAVFTHHSKWSPLHLLSHSKENTYLLTKFQHTGHICCHAFCHRGHGWGHSPVCKKAFHSSLGFHIPCKDPLKRQIITWNTFMHFNTQYVHQGITLKECQVSKVLVTHITCSWKLVRNSNYIVKLLSTYICKVVYLLKGKRALDGIRMRKYFLKLDSTY